MTRSERLERRYRRLLLAYPAEYRTERGDEIVGVLLDCAGPDRSRPSVGDAFDLVRAGIVQRLRRRGSATASPWTDAFAILTVVLPIVLGARAVRFAYLAYQERTVFGTAIGDHMLHRLVNGWQSPTAWVVVAVLVLLGLPRLALAGAVVATVVDAVYLGFVFLGSANYVITGLVPFLLVEIATILLLADPTRTRRGRELVGAGGLALAAAAAGGLYLVTRVDWPYDHLGDAYRRVGDQLQTNSGAGLAALASGLLVAAACVARSAEPRSARLHRAGRVLVLGMGLATTVVATHVVETSDARTPVSTPGLLAEAAVALMAPFVLAGGLWIGVRLLRSARRPGVAQHGG